MTLRSLERVSVSFGGVAAVRDVAMRLEAGEIRGLIGPNGAGKTSLINAITGVVASRSGAVRFDGRDITRLQPEAFSQPGIGRPFQHVELYRDETVAENVRTGLYRYQTYGVAAAMLGRHHAAEAAAQGETLELLAAF